MQLDGLSALSRGVGSTVSSGAVVLTSVVTADNGHPVPAMVISAGCFVVWFCKSPLRVLRRSATERLAKKLGTSVHPEDER